MFCIASQLAHLAADELESGTEKVSQQDNEGLPRCSNDSFSPPRAYALALSAYFYCACRGADRLPMTLLQTKLQEDWVLLKTSRGCKHHRPAAPAQEIYSSALLAIAQVGAKVNMEKSESWAPTAPPRCGGFLQECLLRRHPGSLSYRAAEKHQPPYR
eukprot:CAMPEP_0169090482 /NCGR_PEP_ID=MMETSP1015-20121227/15844_1 /TAXON_ID=342587 /ORGANISM="Karlodinium micrum, Strain CCMP2283" /LENGTH=157 /DNA_ID=CAMNT_0009150893 /DNA_START=48 /DNA_END=522 /DNA_ORIENTATION=-